MVIMPTALIADDEPLLRDSLRRQLAQCWPELKVVAEARQGLEALELFERHQPAICFLDVHMPGLSGVEVAQHIGRRAHLVFVTAYDQYALQAFEQGVLDYLVKPVQLARLAGTVTRLRDRLTAAQPAVPSEALLQQLAQHLRAVPVAAPLRW
jgi:DNA-binding LytR/AlgR family response regulator